MLIPMLFALAAAQAGAPPQDPFDIPIEMLRVQRFQFREVQAVADLRSAVNERLSSFARPVEPTKGYRRQCHEAAGRVACTTVPEQPGETGRHAFCAEGTRESTDLRLYYTDGTEPAVRDGRCAAPRRDLPEDWVKSIFPERRFSAAEKAALVAALESDPRLRDQPGLKETFLALIASAPSTDPPAAAARRAHAGAINALAFTPDGRVLLTASFEGDRAALWSVSSRALLGTLGDCGAGKLLMTPDGATAVMTCGREVKIWALPNGPLRATLAGFESSLIDLSIDVAGRTLASAAEGTVTLFSLPAARRLTSFSTVGPGQQALVATSVALTPDGKTVVSGGYGQPLYVRAATPGAAPVVLEGAAGTDITDLAVSPDGVMLAAGYANGAIQLWSLRDRRSLLTRREHGFPVNALTFTADGRWLVSASSDTTAKIWALPDLTVRHALRGHATEVFTVAVSAAGVVATADRNGVVRLWDLATGADKGSLIDPALP